VLSPTQERTQINRMVEKEMAAAMTWFSVSEEAKTPMAMKDRSQQEQTQD